MARVKLRPWIRRLKRWRTEHWFALASVLVGVGSMFIAWLALGLTAYQAYLTRQYQQLSVQPHLFVEFDYDDTGAGWKVFNDGLGPARIRGFKVFIDGISQHATDYFPSTFEKAFSFISGTKLSFRNPTVGVSFKENAPVELFWELPPNANQMHALSDRVSFEVCYCSIYDQCWLYVSKSMITLRDDPCSTFTSEPKSRWWKG